MREEEEEWKLGLGWEEEVASEEEKEENINEKEEEGRVGMQKEWECCERS